MLRIGNKSGGQKTDVRRQTTEDRYQTSDLCSPISDPRPLSSVLCHRNKGLTLIEVLLAVSILAIGIIGVLRAYASSVATLEVGQYTIDAVNLLKAKMADVELAVREDEEFFLSNRGHGDFEGEFKDFRWEWMLEPVEIETETEMETEGLYAFTLTVLHKDNPRAVSLKTYVVDEEEEKE